MPSPTCFVDDGKNVFFRRCPGKLDLFGVLFAEDSGTSTRSPHVQVTGIRVSQASLVGFKLGFLGYPCFLGSRGMNTFIALVVTARGGYLTRTLSRRDSHR